MVFLTAESPKNKSLVTDNGGLQIVLGSCRVPDNVWLLREGQAGDCCSPRRSLVLFQIIRFLTKFL